MTRLMTMTSFLLIFVVIGVPIMIAGNWRSVSEAPPVANVAYAGPSDLQVTIWFPTQQELKQMPLEEYLLGVVAAEMGPDFETEALKAQFLAARTYTVRRMHTFGGKGCPLMVKADVCASVEAGQAYLSLDELKERDGSQAAKRYWQRLQEARDATRGLIITYRGAAIDAVYHSSSGVATASAEDYFGHRVPYLQSVPDPYGKEAPNWEQSKELTRSDLAQGLSGVAIPAATGASLVAVVRMTPTGRVSEVRVGDTVLTARQFREKLGLRSTQFTLQWKDDKLVVTTEGYGHGVGMSQWGANGMAKRGATFTDIIKHYYQGVAIEPIFAE
jgi:stage II sporulation protein D